MVIYCCKLANQLSSSPYLDTILKFKRWDWFCLRDFKFHFREYTVLVRCSHLSTQAAWRHLWRTDALSVLSAIAKGSAIWKVCPLHAILPFRECDVLLSSSFHISAEGGSIVLPCVVYSEQMKYVHHNSLPMLTVPTPYSSYLFIQMLGKSEVWAGKWEI